MDSSPAANRGTCRGKRWRVSHRAPLCPQAPQARHQFQEKFKIETDWFRLKSLLELTAIDLAGTVVEVGPNVTRLRSGDRVISNDIAGWIDGAAPTLETNTTTIMGLWSATIRSAPSGLPSLSAAVA